MTYSGLVGSKRFVFFLDCWCVYLVTDTGWGGVTIAGGLCWLLMLVYSYQEVKAFLGIKGNLPTSPILFFQWWWLSLFFSPPSVICIKTSILVSYSYTAVFGSLSLWFWLLPLRLSYAVLFFSGRSLVRLEILVWRKFLCPLSVVDAEICTRVEYVFIKESSLPSLIFSPLFFL